jgi:hypothetical protein
VQQIKLFKGLENELNALEHEVNQWLQRTGARVISLSGNMAPQTGNPGNESGGLSKSAFAPSDVLLIVLYEVADAR